MLSAARRARAQAELAHERRAERTGDAPHPAERHPQRPALDHHAHRDKAEALVAVEALERSKEVHAVGLARVVQAQLVDAIEKSAAARGGRGWVDGQEPRHRAEAQDDAPGGVHEELVVRVCGLREQCEVVEDHEPRERSGQPAGGHEPDAQAPSNPAPSNPAPSNSAPSNIAWTE